MSSPDSESGGPPPAEAQGFLLAMYKEQCDQARQHETLRQQSTTLILAMCSAAMALSGVLISAAIRDAEAHALFDLGFLLCGYALIGVFIALLAILGRRLSLVHYERNRQHAAQAGAYRRLLERLYPNVTIANARKDARQIKADGGDGKRSQLFPLWANIYWFVTALGALLTVMPLAMALAANVAARCPTPPT